MSFALVDYQFLRRLDLIKELISILDGAQFVVFASQHQVRTFHLGPVEAKSLGEAIKFCFIFVACHIHETQFEGGRSHVKDRMASWLMADKGYRAAAQSSIGRGNLRSKVRAKADPVDAELIFINLWSLTQPVERDAAYILEIVCGDMNIAHA